MENKFSAICTPTATRAEFESILRELDGVGVKWVYGGERPLEWTKFFFPFLWYEDLELSNSNSAADSKQLPRAEFIATIKRDFAPKIDCSYPTEIKEKPKMNYNKMTKTELINKLKFENACNDELRSNYGILKDENELHRVELGRLQGQNRKCFEQITSLEKTNAEQAETIENIRNRSISIEEVARMAQGERDNANYALRIANAENTRLRRLIAQFNADVLEGK